MFTRIEHVVLDESTLPISYHLLALFNTAINDDQIVKFLCEWRNSNVRNGKISQPIFQSLPKN